MSQAVEVTDCVKNWSDIKASYSRKDLGGVVRQISSEIEFVGIAREMIVQEIETNYLHAEACFAIYTIDDNWNYNQRWSCPLDFSSFEDDGNVCKLGSIDNSAAALIKSKKSTKFEYEDYNTGEVNVGELRNVFGLRLKCTNQTNATHNGVSTGGPMHDTHWQYWYPKFSMEFYDPETGERVNQPEIALRVSDQEGTGGNGDSFDGYQDTIKLLTALQNCIVEIDPQDFYIRFYDVVDNAPSSYHGIHLNFLGEIISVDNAAKGTGIYVFHPKKRKIQMNAGQILSIYVVTWIEDANRRSMEYKAEIKSWNVSPVNYKYAYFAYDTGENPGQLETVTAKSASVEEVADKLCRSIGGVAHLTPDMPLASWDVQRIKAKVDTSDWRSVATRIVTASSIRNLYVDKLYTSFNDFCNFVSACFGYDYTIEKRIEHYFYIENIISKYDGEKHQCIAFDGIADADVSELHENYIDFWNNRQHLVRDTLGINPLKLKYVFDEDTINTPVLYRGGQKWTLQYSGVYLHDLTTDTYYRTGADENGHWGLQYVDAEYDWSEDEGNIAKCDVVEFKPRSNMFDASNVKVLKSVNNFSIKAASDMVYAGIKVGAEQRDYEDMQTWLKKEFNSLYQYTTGAKTSDKELVLVTPYRIDGNGVQYKIYQNKTVEKKSDDKTEDKDLFAILCMESAITGQYAPREDEAVKSSTEVALPDGTINGYMHPRFMVEANKELIGISTDLLTYASCDGNSQVTVDGVLATDNIDIDARMAKAFRVEIETSDIEEPENFNGLIQFEWQGKTYRGYILDADFMFAEEAVKYTLLVKEIA